MNLRDGFPHPYQLSDAEDFLSKIAQQNPRLFFAIADDKEAIGSIGLMLGEDVHRFAAEMGYWLAGNSPRGACPIFRRMPNLSDA
jgi:hypothetical protein